MTMMVQPQVTSAFLYVRDIIRSVEFYNEVVGAEVVRVLPEDGSGPTQLAILRMGGFSLMLHPMDSTEDDPLGDQPVGIGMHLQMRVPDIDAFHQHCLEQGAILNVSGEPVDQPWEWREFALKDPDGFVWSVYQDKSDGKWL